MRKEASCDAQIMRMLKLERAARTGIIVVSHLGIILKNAHTNRLNSGVSSLCCGQKNGLWVHCTEWKLQECVEHCGCVCDCMVLLHVPTGWGERSHLNLQ